MTAEQRDAALDRWVVLIERNARGRHNALVNVTGFQKQAVADLQTKLEARGWFCSLLEPAAGQHCSEEYLSIKRGKNVRQH